MKVEYKPSVYKNLKKIPRKDKEKILKRIDLLPKRPVAGKKLRGDYANFRSLKAWPYRIIYKIEKNIIMIYSISHRQSAYKN